MNFDSFLNITKDFEDIDTISKGTLKVSLFSGRFQPFHKGHIRIVDNILSKYPEYKVLIGIIKGAKTSLNKKLNPLSFDYQNKLIRESLKDYGDKVIVYRKPLTSGYLPIIFRELRLNDYEVKVVTAGEDRAESYRKIVKNMNNAFSTVDLKFMELNRTDESSTNVREAIRDDDFNYFRKLTNPNIWDEFEILKEELGG